MAQGRGPEFGMPQEPAPHIPQHIENVARISRGLKESDLKRAEELSRIRLELSQSGVITPPSQRMQLLRGDFADIGELAGNKLILPEETADEIREVSERYAGEHRIVNPFYFINGNSTATDYNGSARNRSTITGIKTLADGRRIFLIDPKWSAPHRMSDTFLRRLSGSPARKVTTAEWKKVFTEKSRIPVLQAEDQSSNGFPPGNIVALPFIPNVNGFDFFANNKHVVFPPGYEWAAQADAEMKIKVARNAMFELGVVHAEGIAWGEPAAHNMLIADQGRNVIIVDPEVEYDDIPLGEAQARDVLDLTVSTVGGMSMSGDVKRSDYESVASEVLSMYPDHNVLGKVEKLSESVTPFRRMLYPLYEQKRMNNLPFAEYERIISAIHTVAH